MIESIIVPFILTILIIVKITNIFSSVLIEVKDDNGNNLKHLGRSLFVNPTTSDVHDVQSGVLISCSIFFDTLLGYFFATLPLLLFLPQKPLQTHTVK